MPANQVARSLRMLAMSCVLAALAASAVTPVPGAAQTARPSSSFDSGQALEARVTELEEEVDDLDDAVSRATRGGGVLFLAGVFCALWAQNTRRNAWLWFFLGVIFSAFTLVALLYKNSQDRLADEGDLA